MTRLPVTAGIWALAIAVPFAARADRAHPEIVFDVHAWKVIDRESGPVNYYKVAGDPTTPYIHSAYRPPMETVVLGYELTDEVREKARRLRWTWRAVVLPKGGKGCGDSPDSAATVYVTWKRGLRWYTLKYVWSTAIPKGSVCENKRNLFVAQDTIVAESGGPTNVWVTEEIDLKKEFRRQFEDGDPDADVPDWKGVAIMTDGDQTATESSADFGTFVIVE